jgi:hypothetical protein
MATSVADIEKLTASRSPSSRRAVWVGRVLSGIGAAFMAFDAALKILALPMAVEGSVRLGFAPGVVRPLGIVQLLCLVLYLFPRTAVLGAVLLTGYLGGAVETHVRLGDPLFSHVLFPTYVAALLWGGLWLRDGRVRALTARPQR